jgi:hypothetical protein
MDYVFQLLVSSINTITKGQWSDNHLDGFGETSADIMLTNVYYMYLQILMLQLGMHSLFLVWRVIT